MNFEIGKSLLVENSLFSDYSLHTNTTIFDTLFQVLKLTFTNYLQIYFFQATGRSPILIITTATDLLNSLGSQFPGGISLRINTAALPEA